MPEYVPGLEGIPAARSSISFVDGEAGILEYRGYRIETLAEQSNYEEVTYLLFYGKLPSEGELKAFSESLNTDRGIPDELGAIIRGLPTTAHPMAALQVGVAALGSFDEKADFSEPAERDAAARRIVAKIPTLVATFHRYREGLEPVAPDTSLGHAADFLRMLTGEDPDELGARIMDAALVLHADHTMNASTFTSRVAGSSGASPYAAAAAAVGSLSGPLHGGANERVLIQLREIGSKSRVRDIVTEMVDKRQKIMGLGHRVYKTKDPRAHILQRFATELFKKKGKSDVYGVAVELEKVAGELLGDKRIYANVDFYSGILYDKMGIPTDLFTPIFAVARAAGWMAHWLEQMSDNRIFRPRQVYEGEHDVQYIPIGDR